MEENFVVSLRLIPKNPQQEAKMLVQLRTTSVERIEKTFEDFAKAAAAKKIPKGEIDVYIGYWGTQADFKIPKSFFDLISKTGWEVTFDLND